MSQRSWTTARLLFALVVACLGLEVATSRTAQAQLRSPHFENWGDLPPGEVGRRQIGRGGPLRGYFQPVEVSAPEGAHVSLLVEGRFHNFETSSALVGLLIGDVYKVRITRIPGRAGFEVYPSIEIIDRLYPPQGLEDRFPIPVVVTQDDLDRAVAGEFVVRVVYLEDPIIAMPIPQRDGEQRSIDINGSDDPLVAADQLGRPMAIVRIGSRVPDEALGGGPGWSPPLQLLKAPEPSDSDQ